MKRLLLYITLALMAIALPSAKNGDMLLFDKTSHDFGLIAEDGGVVTAEFEFTNISNETIAILTVNASCGCTKPEYSKKPMAPGNKRVIKVTFNPKGRPGTIRKHVNVLFRGSVDKERHSMILRLKGSVKREASSVEEQ